MMQQPAMYAPYQFYNASPNHYAPQKARKMIENFSYGLQDQIGKGFSSKVFKGKNETTQELVAVKVIDLQMLKTPLHHSLLKSEIEALSLLNHPNIMKLFKVFQTSNNTYLITEFCDGGDLASKITKNTRQSEQFTQNIIMGVVQGYKEMKKKGIIHRDIKPANVLIQNGVPKIADFGFATTPNSPPMLPNVNVGSPLYMSPQALKQNRYSAGSDIWAIGVTAFELLCGQVPWQACSEKELAQRMVTVPVQFPFGVSLTPECLDFIRRCLVVDEQRRITIEEMESHPWLQCKSKLQPTPGTHLQSKQFAPKQLPGPGSQMREQSTFTSPLGDAKNKEFMNNQVRSKADYYGKENSAQKRRDPTISSVAPVKRHEEDIIRQKSMSKHHGTNKVHRQSINGNDVDDIFRTERNTITEQSYAYAEAENRHITAEEIKRNDHVILSQINFCRYLNRISNLLEKVPFFASHMMREKMLFFVQKNIMIKVHKLREMVLQLLKSQIASPPTNTLNLVQFTEYAQGTSFQKIAQVIQSYYSKFALNFSTLWLTLQQQRTALSQDKKFDAVFDENLTEFESFYIILHSVLRGAVRDLDMQLEDNLRVRDKEPDQQLPLTVEDGVVLLDYLVTYFQLTALILDQFNEYELFATQSKIEQIAEGKPVRLTFGHFIEIRNKIHQLEI